MKALTSDNLLKIVDVFSGSRKVKLCQVGFIASATYCVLLLKLSFVLQDIMEWFRSYKKTSDAVLINTLFDFGRTVHDSLDCLSPVGEAAYRGELLVRFIEKVDFGKDLEQQLNFYVECRY